MTHHCRLCNSTNLESLIDFGNRPITKRLLKDESQFNSEYLFPIELNICKDCGFVQISNTIPDEELYSEYGLPSSWKFQPHVEIEVNLLADLLKLDSKILEIGCNDGMFLNQLKQKGFNQLLGVEPSKDVAHLARTNHQFNVISDLFGVDLANKILAEHSQFDCILSRQVLEHVSQIDSFMQGINLLLKSDGYLMLEVPDFDVPLQYGDVSAIWEEHVNYFTEASLKYLIEKHGFKVLSTHRYDFSGGAIYMIAQKVSTEINTNLSMPNEYLKNVQFKTNVENFKNQLITLAQNEIKNNGKIAVYGGGNRAVILINYFLKDFISIVVDDQKEKQNYYLPQNHLKIESSDNLLTVGVSLCLLAVNSENDHKVVNKFKDTSIQFKSILSPYVY